MKQYKKVTTPTGNTIIQYQENNVLYSIPVNENNTEYQEYLKWVSEGNVAEEVIDGN